MTEAESAFVDAASTAPADVDLVLLLEPLVDATGEAVDARILFANDAWKASFGAVGRDIAGLRLLESFPMLGGPRWDAIVEAHRTGKDLRLRVRHPVVPTRSASVQLTPMDGRILIVAREMTTEDALRDQLHASDARFRRALDQVLETISIHQPVFDEAGAFTGVRALYLNRTARERWFEGRPLEELAGVDLFEAYPRVRDALFDIYAEVATTGRAFQGIREFELNGRPLWVDIRVALTPDGLVHTSRDITATYLAMQELERHRTGLAEAQRIAHVGSWTYDPAADQASWSDELYRIFGLEPGGPAPSFEQQRRWISPASQAAVSDAMARAVADASSYELLIELRRDDGEVRFAMARGEAFPAADGSTHLRGTLADVTDVERSRAALQASEERFAAVVSSVQESIAILRPVRDEHGELVDHEIEWTNDIWHDVMGVPREPTAVGRRAFELLPGFRTLLPLHRRVLESGVHERVEVPLHGDRWLEIDFNRMGDGIIAVTRDVTARHEAEDQARARLVAAIEQTSETVVVTDTDWRILYVNPAFERTSGYTHEEALGQDAAALLDGVPGPGGYEAIRDAIANGETWRGEFTSHRKDGTAYTEEASSSPIRDASGHVTAIVTVKRDVTAERALEAQLRQAQRLESIGQLAGGVAHDFNNVLAAIRGYGEFVQGALPEGSQEREDMDQVMRAAERATALTRQLLAFSRRLALDPRVLDAATVIDDLVPMLRRLLGEHIELEVDHEPGRHAILADPTQLEQVILNLAINARDAMPDGGRLEIRTANVELPPRDDGGEALPGGPHLRITVSDTGTGMAPATLARIFEPFFTTKEPGKGTGMGLATVFGIVRATRGQVHASSAPGEGTTFIVDLPAVSDEVTSDAGVAAPMPLARAYETVLVAEDEPAVRGFLVRVLTGLGYHVVEASTGAEALARADATDRRIDLLLTDVRMPGMQGSELAARVRQARPGVAVLYVSAFADDLPPGIAGREDVHVLEKPFDAGTLARAVRARLDEGAAAGPGRA